MATLQVQSLKAHDSQQSYIWKMETRTLKMPPCYANACKEYEERAIWPDSLGWGQNKAENLHKRIWKVSESVLHHCSF